MGLRDQARAFDDAGCTILGISFDQPAANQDFRHENGFPFTLLSDPDKSVGTAYEVVRDPDQQYADFPQRISYLIDPGGTIVRSYEVTDPSGHAAEVIADLTAAKR